MDDFKIWINCFAIFDADAFVSMATETNVTNAFSPVDSETIGATLGFLGLVQSGQAVVRGGGAGALSEGPDFVRVGAVLSIYAATHDAEGHQQQDTNTLVHVFGSG